ncbi:PIG-L deacetylase family protein [Thermoflexus sp.]|uniref:PIG-L deacetylase family protein n=1 Tax=Thermoflexus sp. TaxID=1969742 RepID=UPI0025FE0AE6|nr:PIG-L family deacetylase [Thermoflexus sp.]MCS6964342.1 PIG-L family deacetylase [Thermoflexus sp.]MDW8184626.1 PIG-L family deacetylase [Anaerolineae bacterium]
MPRAFPFVKPAARIRVLSPHLDDAVLSCGGTLHRARREGHPVEVITVFAGDPLLPLPPFAQVLHDLWGGGENAMAMRRAEDGQALALLQATPIHWGFPDTIYRRDARGQPLCLDREDLFRPPHPDEAAWIERIQEALAALPWEEGDLLLAPLALGGHVDHRLVRMAVEGWRCSGILWGFYEDFPYAEWEGFSGLPDGLFHRVELTDEDLQIKAQAIRAYRSQWPIFFTTEEEILERIRAYALRVGEGIPAERFWFLRPGPEGRP